MNCWFYPCISGLYVSKFANKIDKLNHFIVHGEMFPNIVIITHWIFPTVINECTLNLDLTTKYAIKVYFGQFMGKFLASYKLGPDKLKLVWSFCHLSCLNVLDYIFQIIYHTSWIHMSILALNSVLCCSL